MAAPVYSNYVASRATASSITVTHVDTVQAVTTGDLLILILGSDSNNPGTNSYVFDTPTGYTQLGASSSNGLDVSCNVFWKIAELSDESATSFSVTHNAGTDDLVAFHVLVTGVDGADPIYETATTASNSGGNSSSWAASVAATNVDDSLCLYGNIFDGADGDPFSVSGTGWTQRGEFDSPSGTSGTAVSGCFGTLTQATQGTPAQPTIGANASDGQHALYFVVNPGSSEQTATADFISSGSATYEATPSGTITKTADFISSGSAVYEATQSSIYTATVDFITRRPSDDFSGDLSGWTEYVSSGWSINGSDQLVGPTSISGDVGLLGNDNAIGLNQWAKVSVENLIASAFPGIGFRTAGDGSGWWLSVEVRSDAGTDTYVSRFSGSTYTGGFATADLDWVAGDTIGAAVTGTVAGDGAVLIRVWRNPSGASPHSWGNADLEHIHTAGALLDTGDYVGISTQSSAGTQLFDDFVSGYLLPLPTATPGSVTKTADFISSGAATYEATPTPGSVTKTADYISSGSATYEPTASSTYTATADFISSGSTTYEATATPGEVTKTADYISSGSSIYEPTATPGAVTKTADYISSGSATYEATPTSIYTATADFISSGAATYEATPSGSITKTADYISSGSSIYEATATLGGGTQNRTADYISSGSAIYEATPSGTITKTADYISSGSATYEATPTSTYTATADFISSGSSVYEPTVTEGEVTKTVDFISSGSTVYEVTPSSSITKTVDFISSGSVVYEITPSGTITKTIDFISSGSAVYEATPTLGGVTQNRTADFISSGSAVYEATPTAIYTAVVDYISSGSATYEPAASSTYTATVDFISSGSTIYEATATPGEVTRTADFISSGSAVYEPTVSSEATKTVDFIPSGSATYEPTATPGEVTRTADFISSGSVVYEPGATAGTIVNVDFISSGSSTYEPTATPGEVIKIADYISSGSTAYEPTATIAGEAARPSSPGGGRVRYFHIPQEPKRRKKSKKKVVERIRRVVEERVEDEPVDFDLEKLNEISRKVEEILQQSYELGRLQKMAAMALQLEKGRSVPYKQIEVLRDVNEDFIPVVDEVIKEEVIKEEKRKPYDRKHDEIISLLLTA